MIQVEKTHSAANADDCPCVFCVQAAFVKVKPCAGLCRNSCLSSWVDNCCTVQGAQYLASRCAAGLITQTPPPTAYFATSWMLESPSSGDATEVLEVLRHDLLRSSGFRSMLPERRNQGTLHPQDLDRITAMPPSSLYTLHQGHTLLCRYSVTYLKRVSCPGDFLNMNDSKNKSQVTQDTTLTWLHLPLLFTTSKLERVQLTGILKWCAAGFQ